MMGRMTRRIRYVQNVLCSANHIIDLKWTRRTIVDQQKNNLWRLSRTQTIRTLGVAFHPIHTGQPLFLYLLAGPLLKMAIVLTDVHSRSTNPLWLKVNLFIYVGQWQKGISLATEQTHYPNQINTQASHFCSVSLAIYTHFVCQPRIIR